MALQSSEENLGESSLAIDIALKKLSCFFSLSLTPEASDKAIRKAYLQCLKLSQQKKLDDRKIVELSYRLWKKYQNSRVTDFRASSWKILNDHESKVWTLLCKEVFPEELISLIWVKVLNISPQRVSETCQWSLGSVRFRVSQALKVLSRITRDCSRNRDAANV